MEKGLGDLASNEDITSTASGSKRQKCSNGYDTPRISKKCKGSPKLLLNSRQEECALPVNCGQKCEVHSISVNYSTENVNSFESYNLPGRASDNISPELEAGINNETLSSVQEKKENFHPNFVKLSSIVKSASSMELSSDHSISFSLNKPTEVIQNAPQNLQSNRKGFWEALKVHVERPHILNRRLCGVVDVWWGSTSIGSKSNKFEKADQKTAFDESMDNLRCNGLQEEVSNQAKRCSEESLCEMARALWKILNSNSDSELDKRAEISYSDAYLKSGLKLTALEQRVVVGLLGRGFETYNTPDPLVEACSALASGNSESCYVVVRRVLPKLQERFSSVTEVVIMDGTSNSCCFLSEVRVPPLLPARPYVICCQDSSAVVRVSFTEGTGHRLHVTGDSSSGINAEKDNASTEQNDFSATEACTAIDKTGTAVGNPSIAAGEDGIPAVDARIRAVAVDALDADTTSAEEADSNNINTASVVASNFDGSDANDDTTGSNEAPVGENTATGPTGAKCDSKQMQLFLKPSGFFQCYFINGICEDSSKGDGRMWLESTVLPRLQKWAVPLETREPPTRSLQLVDLQSYGAMYHNLKSKYAARLIQSWSERTDPKKFVHEDIGIATYLLLLWSELPRPQRFVDLGCGNGLLVHILTKEGHVGTGYDIKRRNIWQEQFPDVDLQEHEVRPDSTSFSADVDWLIGNHSDELTPWIPVMAARCSHTCSFFLLPCCPHDFTAKFVRRNTSKSQYGDYLDYVSEVGRVCGFKMERDRLKIPSTKRECFVGRSRLHSEQDRPAVLAAMQQFINSRIARSQQNTSSEAKKNLASKTERKNSEIRSSQGDESHSIIATGLSAKHNGTNASVGLVEEDGLRKNDDVSQELGLNSTSSGESSFVARPKEQKVRNCTQLATGVKEDLVKCVVDFLLRDCDVETGKWSQGACTELRMAAGMLRPDQLLQIKQECGGLKTLLKNHRHIFLVEGSTVRLRTPGRMPDFEKRQRPCWFSVHHPQGCPNSAADCMYCH